jgi:hypothetical protein
MTRLASILASLVVVSACAGPMAESIKHDPVPGRISAHREVRDQETCDRINDLVERDAGFVFEIARDCKVAVGQILNSRTSIPSFDVARAYLDALHDYANAVDFLSAQDEGHKVSSDFGAYLIGQQTGLIGAMQDWRFEHGMKKYPALYHPVSQTMV